MLLERHAVLSSAWDLPFLYSIRSLIAKQLDICCCSEREWWVCKLADFVCLNNELAACGQGLKGLTVFQHSTFSC